MYRDTSTLRAEAHRERHPPVQNAQLEFNPIVAPAPVLIIKALAPGNVAGPCAVDAAAAHQAAHDERRRLQAEALAEFQHKTQKRLRKWHCRELQASKGASDQKRGMHGRKPAYENPACAQQPVRDARAESNLAATSTQLGRSLASSRSESFKARSKMLRFTRGRKSFRVVSSEVADCNDVENNATLPTCSAPSPRPRGRREQSGEKHGQVADTVSRTQAQSSDTCFLGLETLKSKELCAKRQAEVRKKEASFGRLLARRQRALEEHRRHNQLQEKQWARTSQAALAGSEQQRQAESAGGIVFQPLTATAPSPPTSSPNESGEGVERVARRRERDQALRYISALQHKLEDIVRSRGGTARLPLLCTCHAAQRRQRGGAGAIFQLEESPASPIGPAAPWERCANNCRFYHNPQAYARELGDLFRSLVL
mmetsp:Transcript_12758/g.32607  ORF Transcript_12758/g.32607 Transcript_12758/m.32607 type:complete len:427 (+) Transcript_12758:145-1425(+)